MSAHFIDLDFLSALMVPSERFELPTLGLEDPCSVQLSYEGIMRADFSNNAILRYSWSAFHLDLVQQNDVLLVAFRLDSV